MVHADSLTYLPTLPQGFIDAVITDPPYNSGGRTPTERTTTTIRRKYVSSDAQHALEDFVGDSRDQRSYSAWLAQILAHALAAASTGAPLVVFTDWRQLPATSDALQVAGWTWRGALALRKPINRPQRGRFRQECEFMLWGTNGPVLADRNPVYLPGFYVGSQPKGGLRMHITQKPLEVMRDLVRICPPGGRVLDPFAGSGTTGVASVLEDRGFLGVELSEHYADIATRRINETVRADPAG
ncbi:MAG: site-specific DNA-methyltransferase [Actinobacteria bacterium]|nr:site-specific DNA-methyltransferase [Actinomycetota bacterium]MBI3687249.1 site-specific DNA-methyltransferase [Actinomycetota bacterium]